MKNWAAIGGPLTHTTQKHILYTLKYKEEAKKDNIEKEKKKTAEKRAEEGEEEVAGRTKAKKARKTRARARAGKPPAPPSLGRASWCGIWIRKYGPAAARCRATT